MGWNAEFDQACASLISTICDCSRSARERDGAWKKLLVLIAPHVEEWTTRSRLLRRAGLANPDDARTVLVAVFARLSRDDFDNLRSWLARGGGAADEALETDAVERLVAFARASADYVLDIPSSNEDDVATPFRGWLLNVVRFVTKDHVKQRLGWSAGAKGAPSKRDLGTDAERLDAVPDEGVRPPVTDLVALRRLLEEIGRFTETFPAPMKKALESVDARDAVRRNRVAPRALERRRGARARPRGAGAFARAVPRRVARRPGVATR